MSSLYLEHFRLGEAPFGITPNGKFFFEGQARGAILDALHHAVLDEDGIVVVVGEVGSGKTMLCRMLAERLPSILPPLTPKDRLLPISMPFVRIPAVLPWSSRETTVVSARSDLR